MSGTNTRALGYSDARSGARLAQWFALARYKSKGAARFADVKHRGFQRILERLQTHLGPDLTSRRIVEVGCGQWRANLALLGAQGADVIGVDPEVTPEHLMDYPSFARDVGVERALKTLANELLQRRAFDAELLRLAGARASREIQTVRGVAEALPFDDETFDAVISDNVFEHLPDVPAAIAEIARVLRPSGVAVIVIHPFTALSGGHHPGTICHDARADFTPSIPCWDHLRGEQHDSGVFLNRWRPDAYLAAFEQHLETLEDTRSTEGEHLLSDAIRDELRDYRRDELLTGRIVYVGRKER